MNRKNLYFLAENAPPTFSRDETLEKLPLPKLEETLQRYERNLLPFGSEEELKTARQAIEKFKNGVGTKLQKLLEKKATEERNWVRK